MTIRPFQKKDIEAIVELCAAHANYEKTVFDPTNKASLLLHYLFDKDLGIKCWVVESAGKLVGYTTFMKQFSTWDAG